MEIKRNRPQRPLWVRDPIWRPEPSVTVANKRNELFLSLNLFSLPSRSFHRVFLDGIDYFFFLAVTVWKPIGTYFCRLVCSWVVNPSRCVLSRGDDERHSSTNLFFSKVLPQSKTGFKGNQMITIFSRQFRILSIFFDPLSVKFWSFRMDSSV